MSLSSLSFRQAWAATFDCGNPFFFFFFFFFWNFRCPCEETVDPKIPIERMKRKLWTDWPGSQADLHICKTHFYFRSFCHKAYFIIVPWATHWAHVAKAMIRMLRMTLLHTCVLVLSCCDSFHQNQGYQHRVPWHKNEVSYQRLDDFVYFDFWWSCIET